MRRTCSPLSGVSLPASRAGSSCHVPGLPSRSAYNVAQPTSLNPRFNFLVPTLTFAQLPATVERLLAGGSGGLPVPGRFERFERVGLVLLDSFGWRFAERHADHPLLRRLAADAPVMKLRRSSRRRPRRTSGRSTRGCRSASTGCTSGTSTSRRWTRVITPILFCGRATRAATRCAVPASRRPTCWAAGADALPAAGAPGRRLVVFQPAAFSPSTVRLASLRARRRAAARTPRCRRRRPRWPTRCTRRWAAATRTSTGTGSTAPATAAGRPRREFDGRLRGRARRARVRAAAALPAPGDARCC